MLATDCRGSMQATDVAPDAPGRRAQRAAQRFVDAACRKASTSASWRSTSTPRVLQSPTRDRAAVDAALDQLTPSGGTGDRRGDHTPRTDILQRAARRQRQAPAGGDRAALRRRLDAGSDPVAAARRPRASCSIPIYTVALGTAQRHDHASRAPGGQRHRDAPRAARPAVAGRRSRRPPAARPSPPPTPTGSTPSTSSLGSQLGTQATRKREVTAALRRRRPACCCSLGAAHVAALVRPPRSDTKGDPQGTHDRPRRRRPHPAPRGAARRARGGAVRDQARDRRPGRDARAPARRAAGRRPRAARGRARPGQDADRQDARRRCSAARFRRIQFTPDLVPADLVGTRIYRPDTGRFDTELGPVFGNFLLADEINRAPAKVQSALLEVMQEHQVTIGGDDATRCPRPFLVLATQNPIESEGTYPLPEAQVDRFLMKIVVDYPTVGRGGRGRRPRARPSRPRCASALSLERPRALRARPRATVLVDRDVIGYAVALADATRNPGELRPRRPRARSIEYGASPRGPIGLVAGRAGAGAAARPRPRRPPTTCATSRADVLRHRLVLSYDALSDGVTADDLLERVLGDGRRAARPTTSRARAGGGRVSRRGAAAARRAARAPGRCRRRWSTRSTSSSRAAPPGALPGDRRAAGRRRGHRARAAAPVRGRRRRAPASTPAATRAHRRCRTCACTCPSATLTTWIVLDVSPSMAFGTAERLKSDVAEGVALVLGRLAVRRAGRVGAGDVRRRARRACCRRAASRPGARRAAPRARRGRRRPTAHDRAARAGRRAAARRRASRASPGLVVVVSDFRDQHGWTRAARRAARAPLGAGGRGRRPARGRAARRRPPGARRPRDRRARRGRHLAPRACASASPRSSASAATASPRELRRAARRPRRAVAPTATGCVELGRRLR